MAKGIASGLPLSGILARRELLEPWAPGAHGGTYGGNVVSCAAANATLDVIEDEGLVANAAARGRQLLDGLRAVQPRFPSLGDVRGLGCMVGLEFVEPGVGRRAGPEPVDLVKRVIAGALERGPDRPLGGQLRTGRPDHPATGHDAPTRSTRRSRS